MNSCQGVIAVNGSKKEKIFNLCINLLVLSIGLFLVAIKMSMERESLLVFFNWCSEKTFLLLILIVLFFLFIMLGNIGFTYGHEFLHWVFARLYKYEAWTEVNVNWRKLLPTKAKCHFGGKERIKRNPFIIILLAPLTAFLILFFLGFYYFGLPVIFFMILMCLKITGRSDDLIMLYQALIKTSRHSILMYKDNKFIIVE